MASPVRLILGRMANVPVRLSRYNDDVRLVKLLSVPCGEKKGSVLEL
jgi:hypothetical protein